MLLNSLGITQKCTHTQTLERKMKKQLTLAAKNDLKQLSRRLWTSYMAKFSKQDFLLHNIHIL